SSGFGAPPGGALPGGAPSAGGPLRALTQLATKPGALSGDAGIVGIASTLTQSMGGAGGIESMAMTFVYPMLKPMLEASIRKLSVKVRWHEGKQNSDIYIIQYGQ